MRDFAQRTGLRGEAAPLKDEAPQRYLWTDAFAVCTYLGLSQRTGDPAYKALALDLVDEVHHTLGQHRADDPRTGWISGLDASAGEAHPTRGGLRIGKRLNERQPDEAFDRRREWDRDGQYYHYLTKWMHALNRVSDVTDEPTYRQWAIELAKAAHDAFTYRPAPGAPLRMYWKMSIDLSYPLVPSMGQHDPLDGWVTYLELQAASRPPDASTGPRLDAEIAEMDEICEGKRWTTTDPLGIGGLLTDTYRLAMLIHRDGEDAAKTARLDRLLDAAQRSLHAYTRKAPLRQPVSFRLAFRELGLSIGLAALDKLQERVASQPLESKVAPLARHVPLRERIEAYWLDPVNRATELWREHQDINDVMLATSLAPEGFLAL
jgi:hypothetical protein